MLAQNNQLPRSKTAKPEHPTTINDLLAHDDINDILSDMDEKKVDIDEILIIYHNHEGIKWVANDLEYQRCLWMLESAKNTLFYEENEDG